MDITKQLLASLGTDRKAFDDRCSRIAALLEANDRAVLVAITRIFDRQTADEQRAGETVHSNGIGFQACDAAFGSRMAKLIARGMTPFPDRMPRLRRMAIRYRAQLAVLSFERDARHGSGLSR